MNASSIFTFVAGAGIGSLVTYFVVKEKLNKHYADLANEEIESVKEVFKKKEEASKKNMSKPSIKEYRNLVKDLYSETNDAIQQASQAFDDFADSVREMDVSIEEPYLIREDEFGDDEDFDTVTMTYYSDGVLIEDCDPESGPVDILGTVGQESLTHFGDPSMGYEECIVYVRNERLHIDYEITSSPLKYTD